MTMAQPFDDEILVEFVNHTFDHLERHGRSAPMPDLPQFLATRSIDASQLPEIRYTFSPDEKPLRPICALFPAA